MMANITRNVPSAGRLRNTRALLRQLLGLRAPGVVAVQQDARQGSSRVHTSADSQISGNWYHLPGGVRAERDHLRVDVQLGADEEDLEERVEHEPDRQDQQRQT